MKSAAVKPKPCRQTTCVDEPRIVHEALLPATFTWPSPALALPTRHDARSLPRLLEMDGLARTLQGAPSRPGEEVPEGFDAAAAALHDAFQAWQDDQVARNALPVRCGPGCGTCCRQYPLGIHAFEVLRLRRHLRARADLPALLGACRARRDNFRQWEEFAARAYPAPAWDGGDREALAQEHDFDEGLPCPFLEPSGSCGIHPVRPLTCRMFLSLSDPAYCSAELNTAPQARQVLLPPDEAVALRLERLDRALDFWGHDGSLLGSLVALEEALARRSP